MTWLWPQISNLQMGTASGYPEEVMKVTKVSLEKKSLEKLLFKREQVGFPERKCLRSHLCSASNSFIGPLVLWWMERLVASWLGQMVSLCAYSQLLTMRSGSGSWHGTGLFLRQTVSSPGVKQEINYLEKPTHLLARCSSWQNSGGPLPRDRHSDPHGAD